MKFNELIQDKTIVSALAKQGIDAPTPIQIDSYKNIMENKNVIARSETGSGKTLAAQLYFEFKAFFPENAVDL